MLEESIIVSELVKGSGRYFTASQNSVPDQRLSGRLFGCLFFIANISTLSMAHWS